MRKWYRTNKSSHRMNGDPPSDSHDGQSSSEGSNHSSPAFRVGYPKANGIQFDRGKESPDNVVRNDPLHFTSNSQKGSARPLGWQQIFYSESREHFMDNRISSSNPDTIQHAAGSQTFYTDHTHKEKLKRVHFHPDSVGDCESEINGRSVAMEERTHNVSFLSHHKDNDEVKSKLLSNCQSSNFMRSKNISGDISENLSPVSLESCKEYSPRVQSNAHQNEHYGPIVNMSSGKNQELDTSKQATKSDTDEDDDDGFSTLAKTLQMFLNQELARNTPAFQTSSNSLNFSRKPLLSDFENHKPSILDNSSPDAVNDSQSNSSLVTSNYSQSNSSPVASNYSQSNSSPVASNYSQSNSSTSSPVVCQDSPVFKQAILKRSPGFKLRTVNRCLDDTQANKRHLKTVETQLPSSSNYLCNSNEEFVLDCHENKVFISNKNDKSQRVVSELPNSLHSPSIQHSTCKSNMHLQYARTSDAHADTVSKFYQRNVNDHSVQNSGLLSTVQTPVKGRGNFDFSQTFYHNSLNQEETIPMDSSVSNQILRELSIENASRCNSILSLDTSEKGSSFVPSPCRSPSLEESEYEESIVLEAADLQDLTPDESILDSLLKEHLQLSSDDDKNMSQYEDDVNNGDDEDEEEEEDAWYVDSDEDIENEGYSPKWDRTNLIHNKSRSLGTLDAISEYDEEEELHSPEFYDLDSDYMCPPLKIENEPRIYSNGFHKDLPKRLYVRDFDAKEDDVNKVIDDKETLEDKEKKLSLRVFSNDKWMPKASKATESNSAVGERLFVKSKTWSDIPVHQYLSREEIAEAYTTSSPCSTPRSVPRNASHSSTLQLLAEDEDSPLPGQIRSPSHRHQSGDRRTMHRKIRPPLGRSGGTAWTLGGDDDATSPLSPAGPAAGSDDSTYLSPYGHQHFYTTPPKQQTSSSPQPGDDRSRLDRSNSSKGSLSRLARRLSNKESRRSTDDRKKALRQRSVSLDCGENRHPLMNQQDSPAGGGRDNLLSIPVSPSLPSKLGHRRSGASSPNLSGSGRLSRKFSNNRSRKTSNEAEVSMRDRKKRNFFEERALFEAIEGQDLDKVKDLLQNNSIDVNSVNEDDLTPLDMAVMLNHVPMTKYLLHHGARENPKFQKHVEARALRMITLVQECEKKLNDLTLLLQAASNGTVNISSQQSKDLERQLAMWEFRHKLLKRMKTGYEHARPPDCPSNVKLQVESPNALLVTFNEPAHHNGAVVTRYKVEWSLTPDFSTLAGQQIIDDPQYMSLVMPELKQGSTYYIQVYAWNIKGYGEASIPVSATPTSWREVCGGPRPRGEGKLEVLDGLFEEIRATRPSDAGEIKDSHTPGSSPNHPRKSTMRKSIKNLFSSAPKFQRSLKRGVYMTCLIVSDDRVLVTNEENLPIIEVDETFSGTSLNADFNWLMKVACTWDDVKSLRQDLDKNSSLNILVFRAKLLQAAAQLQSATGLQDLGQFYHTPIRDSHGSIMLVTCKHISDPKMVSTTHVKWTSLSKLQKRASSMIEMSAMEMVINQASDMMLYKRMSSMQLPRGLYVGYLKLKSSVDMIRIMVPNALPNVLPHTKLRDCPNVTKEEWEGLHKLSMNDVQTPPTSPQRLFQTLLTDAIRKLLDELGITEDEAVSHRIYDLEVIELRDDVSMILVLPPVEGVCSVPGHHEQITQKPNHLTLPVAVFEMAHMSTYKYEYISRYARLSSILEMSNHLAQQAQREAFSPEEVASARRRVDQVARYQSTLDEAWKGLRWIMDIIAYARDKSVRGGLPLGVLYAPPASPSESPNMDRRGQEGGEDVTSSSCSDPGYHSDRSSMENNMDNLGDICEGEVWRAQGTAPGILRVYSAYQTGLAKNVSVKLQVTPRTTAHEVVALVVQQLSKAAAAMASSMAPMYTEEHLADFCLVAVIGARERVLRDDFQPLQLQNPWTKGRLYVRLKTDLLAALEQSGHVTSV